MPKKFDACVRKVRKKIKSGEIGKTYKCTKEGKPSKNGKSRCKSNPYAICNKLR